VQDIKGTLQGLGSKKPVVGELDPELADAVGATAGLPLSIRKALRAYLEQPTAEQVLSGEARPEAFSGPAGALINSPGRALMAEDQFFKTLNEGAAASRMAYRNAKQAGMNTSADIAEHMANTLRNPDADFLKQIVEQGKYRTFQKESGLANWLVQGRERFAPLRYLLPFVRTPWNVTKFAAERSPLGALGIAKDMLTPGGRAAIRSKGPGDLADRMGRAAIGSLITGALAQYGGDNLTGAAPSDPTERDAFYRQGKQPYSFKNPVTGDWNSYQPLQPYSPLIAAVANAKEQLRQHPDDPIQSTLPTAGLAFGQGLLDMPWTQGLADFFDAFSGKGGGQGDIAQKGSYWLNRQAGGLVPGMLKAVARQHDATIRDPQNAIESMLANVPFLEDRVPAALDAFGQPRKRPVLTGAGGLENYVNIFQPSPATKDPVEQELERLQLRGYNAEPGLVGKNLSVLEQPVQLTDEQQKAYQRSSGQLNYAMLSLVIGTPEWNAMSDSDKVAFVDKVTSESRDFAKTQMTPQLAEQAFRSFQQEAQRNAGTPVPAGR